MTTATKLTKAVEASLAEWERLKLRAQKIEHERLADVLKAQKKFDEACEPINAAARLKLDPLNAKMRELEAAITRDLKSGISADGETVAVAQVDVGSAVAEVKDNGKRKISPEEFLKAVPPAHRSTEFYSCLDVFVTKVDKFLPEAEVKRLAQFEHKHSVVIRLKK